MKEKKIELFTTLLLFAKKNLVATTTPKHKPGQQMVNEVFIMEKITAKKPSKKWIFLWTYDYHVKNKELKQKIAPVCMCVWFFFKVIDIILVFVWYFLVISGLLLFLWL